jgi:hypothetical protein
LAPRLSRTDGCCDPVGAGERDDGLCFAFTLVTLKIMGAMHWEALKLKRRPQFTLGDGEEPRLYFAGVVCPRQRVKQSVDHAKPA